MATIRTRKRGKTWSYSFEIGKNPETGRRKMKEKGGFASQDEAYDAGVEAYADWKHGGIGIVSSKVLLCSFFQNWLENVVRPNVKRGTYLQYASRYKSAIKPRMANLYMQDIKPRDVDALVRSMAENGKSKETILGTLSVLKLMFKYAVYPAELTLPMRKRRGFLIQRPLRIDLSPFVLHNLQKRKFPCAPRYLCM